MTCYFKEIVNHRVHPVPNIQCKCAFFSPESCTTDDAEWKIHIKLQASNQLWIKPFDSCEVETRRCLCSQPALCLFHIHYNRMPLIKHVALLEFA